MSDVVLVVIAAAVVLMAAMQGVALIYAARLARRVDRLASQIEQDLGPIIHDLRTLTGDAVRTISLAASQVERFDRLFGEVANRIEQSVSLFQTKVLAPVREGTALMAAVRAAIAAFRDQGESGRRGATAVDEEDALFIG